MELEWRSREAGERGARALGVGAVWSAGLRTSYLVINACDSGRRARIGWA